MLADGKPVLYGIGTAGQLAGCVLPEVAQQRGLQNGGVCLPRAARAWWCHRALAVLGVQRAARKREQRTEHAGVHGGGEDEEHGGARPIIVDTATISSRRQ